MLVILAIAAIAILACVVLVSLGKGGELTEFPPDVPPLDLPEPGQLTAVDFMALQLPVNLVGYHTASVDETLRRAASAISARDTRIAVLEQRVSELLSSRLHARQEVYASPGGGLRTEHAPPATERNLAESGDPMSASGISVSWDGGGQLRHLPEGTEWRLPVTDATAAPADQPAPPAVVSADAGQPAAESSTSDEALGDPAAQATVSGAAGEITDDEKPDERLDEPGDLADELEHGDEPGTAEERETRLDSGDDGGPADDAAEAETAESTLGDGTPGDPAAKDGAPGQASGREEPVRAAMGKDGDERS